MICYPAQSSLQRKWNQRCRKENKWLTAKPTESLVRLQLPGSHVNSPLPKMHLSTSSSENKWWSVEDAKVVSGCLQTPEIYLCFFQAFQLQILSLVVPLHTETTHHALQQLRCPLAVPMPREAKET